MSTPQKDPLLQTETCGLLLDELQIIWNEVGESETERDRMLFEIDQECLEVYRRKVDKANRSRAQLRQEIADSEAELAGICSVMGERPVHIRQFDQKAETLKEELGRVRPELEEMRKRKSDRRNQFVEVQEQIQSISNEIYSTEYITSIVDETDLSLRKLEELHTQLLALQKEKSERLKKVQEHLYTLNSLCSVLGLDFKQRVNELHPSLGNSEGPKSVNNDTINQLAIAIQELRKVKLQRMQRLQDLASTMLELWNLMDTPIEEQQMFQNVTCNIAASEHEVTEPNSLSENFINNVEEEVSRLEELKSSKMKELVLKKSAELEEICRKTHLIPEIDSAVEHAVEAIESGSVDPACVLEQIELQIARVKEEAFVRKEILEKLEKWLSACEEESWLEEYNRVSFLSSSYLLWLYASKEILEKLEKWLSACEEESWLEEYNRDENRYNAGRGSHLTLKRAEKARALVSKIPGMVDGLTSKTVAWEKDKGIEFKYDGVGLLSMLENYSLSRQEKEQERRRQRDLKKLQGQMIAEKEVLYGSKPSPSKAQSAKKTLRSASSRRISLGCQTPRATQPSSSRKTENPQNLDDDVSCFSTARRGLDITGVGSVCDIDPLTRQVFSPLSLTVSSKANAENAVDELNTQSEKLQKTLALGNFPSITSSKTTTVVDQENRTPKTIPIPVPTTPLKVSIPMNMCMTPAPSSVPYRGDLAPEIEYSFEERRLGFVLA